MSPLVILYIAAGLFALVMIGAARRAVRNATPIDNDYDDYIGFQ